MLLKKHCKGCGNWYWRWESCCPTPPMNLNALNYPINLPLDSSPKLLQPSPKLLQPFPESPSPIDNIPITHSNSQEFNWGKVFGFLIAIPGLMISLNKLLSSPSPEQKVVEHMWCCIDPSLDPALANRMLTLEIVSKTDKEFWGKYPELGGRIISIIDFAPAGNPMLNWSSNHDEVLPVMTFSEVVESIKSLSVDEKYDIQLLLQQYLREERRDVIYDNFRNAQLEQQNGELNFSSNIQELKQLIEE